MAFSYVAGLYYQLKVRAVSEWNAEGEWAVESVPQTLAESSAAESEFSVMTGLHELVIVGSLVGYQSLLSRM